VPLYIVPMVSRFFRFISGLFRSKQCVWCYGSGKRDTTHGKVQCDHCMGSGKA